MTFDGMQTDLLFYNNFDLLYFAYGVIPFKIISDSFFKHLYMTFCLLNMAFKIDED